MLKVNVTRINLVTVIKFMIDRLILVNLFITLQLGSLMFISNVDSEIRVYM